MTEENKTLINELLYEITKQQKEVLTANEAADYMGISKSQLYKLTSTNEIPYYKPSGKLVYFNRLELEQWLQSNRIPTQTELNLKAQSYCMKGGLK